MGLERGLNYKDSETQGIPPDTLCIWVIGPLLAYLSFFSLFGKLFSRPHLITNTFHITTLSNFFRFCLLVPPFFINSQHVVSFVHMMATLSKRKHPEEVHLTP